MRIITPKQNEKRIAENVKVRFDTAQALKTARRAIKTMLRQSVQKRIFRG
jgi:hypothetical protein